MRFLKGLGLLAPAVAVLFAVNVTAADWFMGLQDYAEGVPSQSGKVSGEAISPEGILFKGTLSGVNLAGNEIVISTTVPGITGPQTAEVPFEVNEDTTMTICYKSLTECEKSVTGADGLEKLARLENVTGLAAAQKEVAVVQEPESGRIVHVEVEYGL